MGRLGIGDGIAVVAYDDTVGGTAARLVWMLRVLGEDAALLDGGLAAWARPLVARAAPAPAHAAFTARPWPDAGDHRCRRPRGGDLTRGGRRRLDARAGERYRGEIEPVDTRAGHIPGARNLPWASLFDPDTGRFRSQR